MSEHASLFDDSDRITLDQRILEETWLSLTGEAVVGPRIAPFEEAARASLGVEEQDLEWRPGGWKIDISASAGRGAITAGALAGALEAAGAHDIRAAVIAVVIPLIVDLNRVELDPAERALLARIRPDAERLDLFTAQRLYEQLPRRHRRDITVEELEDFLSKLVDAGAADGEGGVYVIRREGGEAWFRLTLR